jgi:signal peptidase II
MLRFLNKKIIINLAIIFSIFALDRFSKIYIIQANVNGLINEIKITNFLTLELVWNRGVAFGLFSMSDNTFYSSITLLILSIILIIVYLSFASSGFKRLAYLMIADIFITLGVVFMIIIELTGPKNNEKINS